MTCYSMLFRINNYNLKKNFVKSILGFFSNISFQILWTQFLYLRIFIISMFFILDIYNQISKNS